jgi:methylthioribose-1-phosphate isomerase
MSKRSAGDVRALEWTGHSLRLLDQTALPGDERWLEITQVDDVVSAIRRLAVRGAPLLGVTAGFGLVLAALGSEKATAREVVEDIRRAGDVLVRSRPTAVNLGWAVSRVLEAAEGAAPGRPEEVRAAVVAEAERILREDEASCLAIGEAGAPLIPEGASIMTHCNTGALATAGIGTALGVIRVAHERGGGPHVLVDETRPLLQGARLTAWELQRLGIPMTLVTDNAAGSLMARGAVDVVVVGADRIAANGDVANKVGTYALAVLAHHHRIPFYVAAPVSTLDLSAAGGDDIVVEKRNPREVTEPFGTRIAPEGTWALNPAFDVTPGRFVSAIVTDAGVARRPYRTTLRRLVSGSDR